MCPTPTRNVADWLRSTPEPEKQVKVAAKFLGEHFNEWPDDGVLAIDDYHWLTSAASEELVALMLVDGGVRLLITSRRRPKWATLVGSFTEDFEVGQSLLAMS
jgi:ATP/maltotriose-dependent transcriptional regulator MalT